MIFLLFLTGMLFSGERWRFGWTTCPGCGSFRARESLLCAGCEIWVKSQARAGVGFEYRWCRRHLLDWRPGVDDILSNLIVSMKGPGADQAWSFWADFFLEVHGETLPALDAIHFAAAPSSSREDHSSLFARALAARLHRPYLGRPLLKEPGSHSRLLSRRDRERIGFVKSTESRLPSEGLLVLVDDVLTTGATARAFRQILPRRMKMEAWTFASRGVLSCGVKAPMLGL